VPGALAGLSAAALAPVGVDDSSIFPLYLNLLFYVQNSQMAECDIFRFDDKCPMMTG